MSINLSQVEEARKSLCIDEYIIRLDHVAYRVGKGEREKAMAEFIQLLPYREHKKFLVKPMNAITAAIKLHETMPVLVVSEGLTDDSIVEKYCQKYGNRIHHLAYEVTDIERVVEILKSSGIFFTTEDIIGSEEEGIKQIFTMPTETTNHIIEYIQRFGDFDGFFTPSNIGNLMKSTEKLGEA